MNAPRSGCPINLTPHVTEAAFGCARAAGLARVPLSLGSERDPSSYQSRLDFGIVAYTSGCAALLSDPATADRARARSAPLSGQRDFQLLPTPAAP